MPRCGGCAAKQRKFILNDFTGAAAAPTLTMGCPAPADVGKGRAVIGACGMRLARNLFPYATVDRRKAGVAIRPRPDVGDPQPVGEWHRLCVDLSASDHRDLRG